MSRLIVALLCWGLLVPALAQEAPETVFRRYEAAMKAQGFSAFVEFTHPDELDRFRNLLVPVFTETQGQGAANRQLMQAVFGSKATPASIKAMAPAEFVRAFLRLVDNGAKDGGVGLGQSDILGAVREGDIVHLVVRMRVGSGQLELTQMEVISFKPYQGTWRLLLSGKVEGLAQVLRAKQK